MKSKLQIFRFDELESVLFPVLTSKVKAGGYGSFESAALDFPDDTIDLLKLLIKDKETIFFAKVTGDSLNDIGIYNNDFLIIQKGMLPKYDDVIVVFLEGEFYVKKYHPNYKENSSELKNIKLKSENPKYSDLFVNEESDFLFWGKVTWNLHNLG